MGLSPLIECVYCVVTKDEFIDAWFNTSSEQHPEPKYVEFYLNEVTCRRAIKTLQDIYPNTSFAMMTPSFATFSKYWEKSTIWSYD